MAQPPHSGGKRGIVPGFLDGWNYPQATGTAPRVTLRHVSSRPPGSRAGLLPPSPLRTTRASFPACRSSLANALLWTRFHYGHSLAMDLGMTVRMKQHAVFGTVGTAMRAPHEMMAMPSG